MGITMGTLMGMINGGKPTPPMVIKKKTMVIAKNHGIMGIEKKNLFFDGDVGL
jgi:hypothetical protein